MARIAAVVAGLVVVVGACGSSSSRGAGAGSGTGTGTGTGTASSAGADACGAAALGLGDARVLPGWPLPAGCSLKAPEGTPTLAVTAAEAAALVACATPSVDPAADGVLVYPTTLSPAGAGTRVFDDGATLTLVHLMRAPCPDDPRPMPMPYTISARVPQPAARTIRELACTLPRPCP